MHRVIHSLLLLTGSYVCASLAIAQSDTYPKSGDVMAMGEIADYYQQYAPFIHFEQEKYEDWEKEHGEWLFEVQKTKHWGNFFYPLDTEINPYTTEEEFFKTNVLAFNAFFRGENFLASKKMAYQNYDWRNKEYRYDRELLAPSFWTGLNHPPVKEIDSQHYSDYHDFFEGDFSAQQLNSVETQSLFDQLSNTELTTGNKLKLLPNQDSILERTKILNETHEYFLAGVMYLSCKGRTGEYLELMMSKATSGVKVFLMVEGMYTPFESSCLKRLKDSGVKILAPWTTLAHSPKPGVMHNKIWIADGQLAVLGGQNLLNHYVTSTGFNHKNRDTDIRVEGPVVHDLARQYIDIWRYWCQRHPKIKGCDDGKTMAFLNDIENKMKKHLLEERDQGVRGSDHYKSWGDQDKIQSSGTCRTIMQFPGKGQQSSIGELLYESMKRVEQGVVFTTPDLQFQENIKEKTFVKWNTKFVDAMKSKAHEGKKVAVLTNGFWGGSGEFTAVFRDRMVKSLRKGNGLWAKLWERQYYSGNMKYAKKGSGQLWEIIDEAPVDIWTYFQYSHSKIFLFDQTLSVVGSFNMDNFSSHNNYETAIFCLDPGLTETLKAQLTLDFANALPVIVPTRKARQNETKKGS